MNCKEEARFALHSNLLANGRKTQILGRTVDTFIVWRGMIYGRPLSEHKHKHYPYRVIHLDHDKMSKVGIYATSKLKSTKICLQLNE